ncbi:MAG: hypothetical protein KC468_27880, partial [Myxococcales bacterium]|nr:hypothetical protein [Myxococcales bacterium]
MRLLNLHAARARARPVTWLWSIVAVTIAVGPTPARATTSLAVAVALDEDADIREAERLFEEGRVHYETSDYLKAVDSYKQAYALAQRINDVEFRREVVGALLFNLARAHARAYGLDSDIAHLRQADELIGRYLALELTPEDQTSGEELQQKIQDELAAAEPETPVEPDEPEPEPAPEPAADEAPADDVDAKPATGLLIAGGVVTGLSAVGLGIMTAGMVSGRRAIDRYNAAADGGAREDIDQLGRRMNALAVAGGVLAGVLLTTGVALLVVG